MYSRGGLLVQPQKWRKGPFSAAIICAEAAGPVLFDGWDENGEPMGRPWSTPWIQVTAATEDQSDNVYRALLPMIELGALKAELPDTGITRIVSNPRAEWPAQREARPPSLRKSRSASVGARTAGRS